MARTYPTPTQVVDAMMSEDPSAVDNLLGPARADIELRVRGILSIKPHILEACHTHEIADVSGVLRFFVAKALRGENYTGRSRADVDRMVREEFPPPGSVSTQIH